MAIFRRQAEKGAHGPIRISTK